MDIRSMQLFQHLAGSLHFGKTAEAMFVSPSALTRTIQRLEEQCGCTLLVRDNRSVRLTAAGEKLLTFCQSVIGQWQALQHELDEHNTLLRGTLCVYCSVTASSSYLPMLVDRFRHNHHQIDLRIHTGDPALSVQQVLDGLADVSIAIHTPDFHHELHFQPLDQIPLVLITPKDSQITRLDDLDWRQHEVILPEAGPSKRIVHHWFAEMGIRPKVYASVGGNEAIVSMVSLGCGVGIVPQVVVDNAVSGGRVNRIAIDNIESYNLGLCCLRQRADEPVIKTFMQHVRLSSGAGD